LEEIHRIWPKVKTINKEVEYWRRTNFEEKWWFSWRTDVKSKKCTRWWRVHVLT